MAPIKQFSEISQVRVDVLTRNVLQVSTVLEPWSTGRDVVGRALALCLDEDGSINDVLAVPSGEWRKELETVRSGADGDGNGRSVLGGSLESVLSWVVSTRWEIVTNGVRELELLSRG
jgi:hypothetical protein